MDYMTLKPEIRWGDGRQWITMVPGAPSILVTDLTRGDEEVMVFHPIQDLRMRGLPAVFFEGLEVSGEDSQPQTDDSLKKLCEETVPATETQVQETVQALEHQRGLKRSFADSLPPAKVDANGSLGNDVASCSAPKTPSVLTEEFVIDSLQELGTGASSSHEERPSDRLHRTDPVPLDVAAIIAANGGICFNHEHAMR